MERLEGERCVDARTLGLLVDDEIRLNISARCRAARTQLLLTTGAHETVADGDGQFR